jgi:hypothetical protein
MFRKNNESSDSNSSNDDRAHLHYYEILQTEDLNKNVVSPSFCPSNIQPSVTANNFTLNTSTFSSQQPPETLILDDKINQILNLTVPIKIIPNFLRNKFQYLLPPYPLSASNNIFELPDSVEYIIFSSPPSIPVQDSKNKNNIPSCKLSALNSCTIPKMVEKITSSDPTAYAVASIFFLTYRLVMSPLELLELLINRYRVSSKISGDIKTSQKKTTYSLFDPLDDSVNEKLSSSLLTPKNISSSSSSSYKSFASIEKTHCDIKKFVLNRLNMWIKLYPGDFFGLTAEEYFGDLYKGEEGEKKKNDDDNGDNTSKTKDEPETNEETDPKILKIDCPSPQSPSLLDSANDTPSTPYPNLLTTPPSSPPLPFPGAVLPSSSDSSSTSGFPLDAEEKAQSQALSDSSTTPGFPLDAEEKAQPQVVSKALILLVSFLKEVKEDKMELFAEVMTNSIYNGVRRINKHIMPICGGNTNGTFLLLLPSPSFKNPNTLPKRPLQNSSKTNMFPFQSMPLKNGSPSSNKLSTIPSANEVRTMACQMTAVEHAMYMDINHDEFVGCMWVKNLMDKKRKNSEPSESDVKDLMDKKRKSSEPSASGDSRSTSPNAKQAVSSPLVEYSPHIKMITAHFNKVSLWVSSNIVQRQTAQLRADVWIGYSLTYLLLYLLCGYLFFFFL